MVMQRIMMLYFQISTTSQVNKDMYRMGHMHISMHNVRPETARDGQISRNGVIWYEMRPYRESSRDRRSNSARSS